MDRQEAEKRIQEVKRENTMKKITLYLTKAVAELLRAAAISEWGDGTMVTITVFKDGMEESL